MVSKVSKRSRWAWVAIVLAGFLIGVPAAQAGGRHHHHHGGGWGVSIGLPGIGLSYVDGHRGGYWGGYVNAYPRPYYGRPYRSAYDDYPPPRYYGGGYYPSYGVVYHERPVVRRVVRTVYVDEDRRDRRYDRYERDEDYGGRRARYYDR